MSSTINPLTFIESIIPTKVSHIKSIDSMVYYPKNSLIYVIGIFYLISVASNLHKKNRIETKKCIAIIMDILGFTIDVTLWDEHCEIEGK